MSPPLALLLVPGLAAPAAAALRDGADWAAFLARADPINAFNASQRMTLPDQWLEASFTGNAMLATQVLVCPGGICRQSLLTGTNTSVPSPDAPLQAVLPLARGDVSDMRSGNDSVVCTEWHSIVTCAPRRFGASRSSGSARSCCSRRGARSSAAPSAPTSTTPRSASG